MIALIGGLWLVRLGLRPLRDMEPTAESIAAGNLTERVPGENDKTEVGRLARTLNVMLSRIESAFSARLASEHRLRASEQRLRRFVADASHELRTPIAAISAYAELFGRGASEQKEDLERLMGGITHRDRPDGAPGGRPAPVGSAGRGPAHGAAVGRPGGPLRRGGPDRATVGPEWPLTFEATRPIEVMGDATSLRQLVDNLFGQRAGPHPAGHRRPGSRWRATSSGR